ncbi:MAG: hypothetical protein AB7O56_02580 [Bauldia sp.]
MRRVDTGHPLRLNAMDAPFGPFTSADGNDEVTRVKSMTEAMEAGLGLDSLIARMVSDPVAPWMQRDLTELPPTRTGSRQFADTHRLSCIQVAASDPGIARYLGFSDRIDELPDAGGGSWSTLAIVGLFALAPRDFARFGVDVTALLQGPAPYGDTLLERYVRGLFEATGEDVADRIAERVERVRGEGLAVAPFVTYAAPVKPWLAPAVPEPQIYRREWEQSREGRASSSFRSSFAFPDLPLASLSALARNESGSWKTRHAILESSGRAEPGIFGHEVEANSRQQELGLPSKVQRAAAILSDYDIPSDGGMEFAVRASDFFGRFGVERVFTVGAPPRPAPPKPILRFHFEPVEDLDRTSLSPLSPGTMKVTVAVPRPWPEVADLFNETDGSRVHSAIVVPRVDDLAPGSLTIASLALGIDAPGDPIDVGTAGIQEILLPVPPLAPQERRAFKLVGRYVDTAGTPSALAEHSFTITDVRPPKTYLTGVGLYWSSAPGPSPDVEVRLDWDAAAGTRHRVYLTDQAALQIQPAELAEQPAEAAPSRGLVAAVGCEKVRNGAGGEKRLFRLMTDPPLTAGADNQVRFEGKLPRTLQTVQFLRVVPLGPDGGEPAFERCGIVPVAVPESRRPQAPRLDGLVEPTTGFARLQVSSEAIDLVSLKRDEPGLFDPTKPGKEPPRAYLRRAVGAVADPIYARTIADEPMALATEGPAFAVEFEDRNADRGLEPFVRYVYWAEVRLPPERRLPARYTEIAGEVRATDPSGTQPHQRPRSLPSAPRLLMRVPPDPPAVLAPELVTITRAAGATPDTLTLNVAIADPPAAHPKAVDQYRLAVWVQWPSQSILPAFAGGAGASSSPWPALPQTGTVVLEVPVLGTDAGAPLVVRLAVIDPVGRMGPILSVNAS